MNIDFEEFLFEMFIEMEESREDCFDDWLEMLSTDKIIMFCNQYCRKVVRGIANE